MSIKVRVQNFQSIEDVSIEIDGLTIVSGPNNAGKSALMRAIKGVFTNADPGPLVRKGQPFCRVDLEFPEGRVVWEKGKGVNRYWVYNNEWKEGKKFDKPGRGVVPDEVKAFGIKYVPVGSDKIWPQVADQWLGQVFLLDKSGSVIAESIADLDRVGRLNRSLRFSEKEKRSINSQLEVRRVDIVDVEKSLELYEGLDLIMEKLDFMEKVHEKLQKVFQSIGYLTSIRDSITHNRGIVECLSPITDVSRVTDEQIQSVQRYQDSISKILRLKKSREKVLLELRSLISVRDQIHESVLDISDLAPTEKLSLSIRSLVEFKKRLVKAQGDLSSIQVELSGYQKESDKLELEMAELQSQIQERILEERAKSPSVCPECGQELPHD